MIDPYKEFLDAKKVVDVPTGLAKVPELNAMLFPFQHDIVTWALLRGRAAIFADCGLGKTPDAARMGVSYSGQRADRGAVGRIETDHT